MRVLLVKVWTIKKSAAVGLTAFFASLLWPSIPLRSLESWFLTLTNLFPTNVLYPVLAFLTGSYAAVYFYNKRVESCCSIDNARIGTSGSLIGIFLGACPACIPFIAFFLPLGLTITLSRLSPYLLVASIAILLFAIYRMNGFKAVQNNDSIRNYSN